MIAHLSISSDNPKETALFFAAIIDGMVFDFPVVDGAFIAVARDGSGTAVEVYPSGMAHHPGIGQPDPNIQPNGPAAMPWENQIYAEPIIGLPSSFHIAIETNLSAAEVISRSQSLGWRSLICDRGGVFGVVEVWVDNLYLVEVLVPEEVNRYRNFMNTTAVTTMFGSGIAP